MAEGNRIHIIVHPELIKELDGMAEEIGGESRSTAARLALRLGVKHFRRMYAMRLITREDVENVVAELKQEGLFP